jgi:hypothetical protein
MRTYFIKSRAVVLPNHCTGAYTLANHQRQSTAPGPLAERSSARAINSLNWLPCPFAMRVSRRLECGSMAAASSRAHDPAYGTLLTILVTGMLCDSHDH